MLDIVHEKISVDEKYVLSVTIRYCTNNEIIYYEIIAKHNIMGTANVPVIIY